MSMICHKKTTEKFMLLSSSSACTALWFGIWLDNFVYYFLHLLVFGVLVFVSFFYRMQDCSVEQFRFYCQFQRRNDSEFYFLRLYGCRVFTTRCFASVFPRSRGRTSSENMTSLSVDNCCNLALIIIWYDLLPLKVKFLTRYGKL